jgi:hypothetical protein
MPDPAKAARLRRRGQAQTRAARDAMADGTEPADPEAAEAVEEGEGDGDDAEDGGDGKD